MSRTRTTCWKRIDCADGLPKSLLREILSRLHYCGEDLSGYRLIEAAGASGLEIAVRAEKDEEAAIRTVVDLVSTLASGYVEPPTRITFDRRDRGNPLFPQVIDELLASGEIQFPGPGRATLRGRPLRLRDAIDRLLLRIASEVGAEPQGYPTLLSIEALERCDYFASFPQYITFATHLREDLGTLRAFVDRVRSGRAADESTSTALAAAPEEVLSPTVCFHCFEQAQDSILPADGGAPRTAINRCYRYEAGNLSGLERLWDFSMREIVFFGPAERVQGGLAKTRDATEGLVDRLELEAWIENAHDAFFIDDFKKAGFQAAFDLKHELRMPLPAGSLSVASWNVHNDFFTRAYGVSLEGGARASSGCLGFGLERFVHAFLIQKGADPDRWPAVLREELR